MDRNSTGGYSVKEMIKMLNSGKQFAKTNFHRPVERTEVNIAGKDEVSYDLYERPPVKREDVGTCSGKEKSLVKEKSFSDKEESFSDKEGSFSDKEESPSDKEESSSSDEHDDISKETEQLGRYMNIPEM